jgi:cytochrome c-type biogenesis protein CcmH
MPCLRTPLPSRLRRADLPRKGGGDTCGTALPQTAPSPLVGEGWGGGWLRQILCALTLITISLTSALAVQPDEVLTDPALETRARTLSRELRCMVCQNQSIDDSDAPLARDLRIMVRERLKAGDSNRQVIDALVSRYGEFVLLRPRLSWRTVLLWAAAPAILLVGILGLWLAMRRRRGVIRSPEAAAPELAPAERARVAELLKEDG